MATHSANVRFRLLQTVFKSRKTKGFTLTELLVAILISGIIVTTLLALVVDLLQNEQRDSARNETQREMQLTMDYIVQDLREAVYVYDGSRLAQINANPPTEPITIPPLTNYIPDLTGQDGALPVLAFWKPESIPYQANGPTIPNDINYCSANFAAGALRQECTDLQLSRRTYSLVVYYQTRQAPTGAWRGRSRLIRYVLRKYSNVATLTKTAGYVDPFFEPSGIFRSWPLDSSGTNQQTASGGVPPATGATVLADFVDSPTNPTVAAPAADDCPANPASRPAPPRDYVRSTPAGSNATYKSFYACVRTPITAENQDVLVFLKGSVWGKPGYPIARANTVQGFLPSLQTQVLMRGVLNKNGS